jgi:hypothetical protein
MHRALLDRWTDTTAFRCVLLLAGLVVLPVLGIGALTTVVGASIILRQQLTVDIEQMAFGMLALGGTLGMVGYARAHRAVRAPGRHSIATTLLLLGIGAVTALMVASFVASEAIASWSTTWRSAIWPGLAALFAAANLVWVLAGIAWMQRLPRIYAEKTGRGFDSLPVMLLFVALVLTTAAALATTAAAFALG